MNSGSHLVSKVYTKRYDTYVYRNNEVCSYLWSPYSA